MKRPRWWRLLVSPAGSGRPLWAARRQKDPHSKSAAAGSRWLERFHDLLLACVFCCFRCCCVRVCALFSLLLLLPLNLLWSLSLPLSLSLLPHAGPLMPMPPCSGSHFGFLVSRPFSQPTSILTNLLVSPREAPCAPPPSLSLLCLFNDHLCSLQMPFLSFPVLSLFVLTHPFLTHPASW